MRYLFALLLLLVAVPARADAPALTLNPTTVDFGTVVVGQAQAKTLQVTNTSPAPVAISGFIATGVTLGTSTCPAASAPLPPGEQCGVELQWSPTAAGPLAGTVNVQSDAGELQATVTGVAVPKLSLSVKAHGKSLHVRKASNLISSVKTNGRITSATTWCTYLGKKLPRKFAKRACGLRTSGSGAEFTAKARALCTKDVTLEGRVTATLGNQTTTWRRTWRVFVQPHAEFHPSEPICAVMGERFG